MRLEGAISAIVTPFTPDGAAIAEEPLRDLVDRTIGAGVNGILTCGGTGEFIALSPDERRRVLEVVVSQVAGRVPVIAQSGGLTTREAIRYTEHAASVGADGVMVAPPFYEPLDRNAAIEYFGAVAAATDLPVMLYNYPYGTRVRLDADLITTLADRFPTIQYVKDSSADPLLLSQLITGLGGKVATFCGEDVLAGAALILGARGLLTGCFNFMMPVFAMMVGAARRGDYGRVAELWRLTLPLIVCLASNPYTSGVKTACQILGHDVGPVRSPLPSISAKGRRDLDANIAALNPAYFA